MPLTGKIHFDAADRLPHQLVIGNSTGNQRLLGLFQII